MYSELILINSDGHSPCSVQWNRKVDRFSNMCEIVLFIFIFSFLSFFAHWANYFRHKRKTSEHSFDRITQLKMNNNYFDVIVLYIMIIIENLTVCMECGARYTHTQYSTSLDNDRFSFVRNDIIWCSAIVASTQYYE